MVYLLNQLRKTIDATHPRNKHKKPYSCYESCLDFNTGWHKFTTTTPKSDLDKFGIGMVLYFRFLKYLAIFFFIFTLLSIPALYYTTKGIKFLIEF